MISDKVISISDLKSSPSKYINSLKTEWEKYIFVHNKPKAVIMDVKKFEMYERLKKTLLDNNIWFSSDENIVNPINEVLGWNEKELIFW